MAYGTQDNFILGYFKYLRTEHKTSGGPSVVIEFGLSEQPKQKLASQNCFPIFHLHEFKTECKIISRRLFSKFFGDEPLRKNFSGRIKFALNLRYVGAKLKLNMNLRLFFFNI